MFKALGRQKDEQVVVPGLELPTEQCGRGPFTSAAVPCRLKKEGLSRATNDLQSHAVELK